MAYISPISEPPERFPRSKRDRRHWNLQTVGGEEQRLLGSTILAYGKGARLRAYLTSTYLHGVIADCDHGWYSFVMLEFFRVVQTSCTLWPKDVIPRAMSIPINRRWVAWGCFKELATGILLTQVLRIIATWSVWFSVQENNLRVRQKRSYCGPIRQVVQLAISEIYARGCAKRFYGVFWERANRLV